MVSGSERRVRETLCILVLSREALCKCHGRCQEPIPACKSSVGAKTLIREGKRMLKSRPRVGCSGQLTSTNGFQVSPMVYRDRPSTSPTSDASFEGGIRKSPSQT